eukprot:TRINITY_DN13950_c0_g1_i4.p1 TRINITY_DN13950_c0_g1~~TRINITY_DN13950_c0_g1_i4.p1  ORF type:complete len:2075 (+),score=357.46 TRINITY_DN13950_c0_g1_i4:259-6483(+)
MAPASNGDLQAEIIRVLGLVAWLVLKLLELSFDLLMLILLVFPLLLPWRTWAVISSMLQKAQKEENFRPHFRLLAGGHFVIAIGDILLAPWAILAILNPLRTWYTIRDVVYNSGDHSDFEELRYEAKARAYLLLHGFLGLVDLLSLALGLVAALHPWRSVYVIGGTCKIIANHRGESDRQDLTPHPYLRILWCTSFFGVLLDWPVMILTLLSMAIPTRWLPLCRELTYLVTTTTSDAPTWDIQEDDDNCCLCNCCYYSEGPAADLKFFNFYALRMLLLQNAALALADFLVCPFFIVASLSIIRTGPLILDLRRDWKAGDSSIEFGRTQWNGKLREHAVRHGCLVVIDIFFLPFFIFSMLVVYRAPAVIEAMARDGAEDKVGPTDPPAKKRYSFSWNARCQVVKQSMMFLLDLLVLPLLIVVLVTFYRVPALKNKFRRRDATFHLHVIKNANVVLCDTLLLVPAVLVVLSVHRFLFLKRLEAKENEYSAREDVAASSSAGADEAEAGRVPAAASSTAIEATAGGESGSRYSREVERQIDVDWARRARLLLQALLVICDVICLPFYLLIALTRYRWPVCCSFFDYQDAMFHAASLAYGILVFFDLLVFLPLFGILFLVSPWRCRERCKALTKLKSESKDGLLSETTLPKVRESILDDATIFLLDIVTAPFALLVFVTRYRLSEVKTESYHLEYIKNGLFVLHDFLFMLPAAGLLLLSVYRSNVIVFQLGRCRRRRQEEAAADLLERQAEMSPSQWQDVATTMARDNSDWLDNLDWSRAPDLSDAVPKAWTERPRQVIWAELGGLLLDLPVLLMALLVCLLVWRLPALRAAVRENRESRSWRCAIFEQLALTFRDLLVLPFFLLLVFSHRCLRVVAQLCAKRNKPLQGNASVQARAIDVRVPEEGKLSLDVEATIIRDTLHVKKDSVGLQLVGTAFWDTVGQSFGTVVAAAGQSMLPLKLRREDTTAYEVLEKVVEDGSRKAAEAQQGVRFSVTLPVKAKRTTVLKNLKKLDEDAWVLIQLEATDEQSRQRFILCTEAVQLRSLIRCVDAGGASLSTEDLGNEVVVQRCQGAQHRGVVDSFASIVAMEFLQYVLDLLHFVLAVLTLIAPWRFVGMLVLLFEPKNRVECRFGTKAYSWVKDLDMLMKAMCSDLVPYSNEYSKNPPRGGGYFGAGLSSDACWEHRQLCGLLEGLVKKVPEGMKAPIERFLTVHREHLYHLVLRCHVNEHLTKGEVSVEEHGIMIELVQKAEQQTLEDLQRRKEDVSAALTEAWSTAKSTGCKGCGFWKKDSKTCRNIVKSMLLAAIKDYVTIVILLLVVITFYRIPPLCRDLVRAKACLVGEMFPLICIRHVKGFAKELALAVQIFISLIWLTVTVMYLPEALEELSSGRHTLRSLRDRYLELLQHACILLCESLGLLLVCETYQIAFKVVMQCILVPPVCISTWLVQICSCLPLLARFLVACLLFYGTALLPALALWYNQGDIVTTTTVARPFLAVLSLLLLFNLIVVAMDKKSRRLPADEWTPPTMRNTWCNLLSLSTVLGQPLALCLLFGIRHMTSDDFQCGMADHLETLESVTVVGLCVAGAWLLVVSTIFVTSRMTENEALQKSPALRVLQLILSQTLFLPTVVALLLPLSVKGSELYCDRNLAALSWLDAGALAALCTYLLTTQMLSSDNGLLEAMPRETGIDVRYPLLYIMGAQLLDLCMIFSIIIAAADSTMVFTVVGGLACASTLWTFMYECFSQRRKDGGGGGSGGACCIPEVVVLRAGGSTLVAWAAFNFALLSDVKVSDLHFMGGCAAIGLLTLVLAMCYRLATRGRRRQAIHESGIKDVIAQMIATESELCVRAAFVVPTSEDGNWTEASFKERWQRLLDQGLSARAFAYELLDFEERILAERLSGDFLRSRADWRTQLRRVRDYDELLKLAKQLHEQLRLPSTVPALQKIARRLLGRMDLTTLLVDLVVGHEQIRSLMKSEVLADTPGPQHGKSPMLSQLSSLAMKRLQQLRVQLRAPAIPRPVAKPSVVTVYGRAAASESPPPRNFSLDLGTDESPPPPYIPLSGPTGRSHAPSRSIRRVVDTE